MDSFLCGGNMKDAFTREVFLQTGLIHLLVVSGGHFAFLVASLNFLALEEKQSSRLKSGAFKIFKLSVLLGFSFMTGFQPPVVRALLSLFFLAMNRYFRWNWDQGKVQLCSGLFALVLFPHWIFSLSLYLSWLTSLALCFSPLWTDTSIRKAQPWPSRLLKWCSLCLLIQCFLSLFFWQFSWLSLLMNLFVAPILMLLLWPLGLMQVFISPLSPLVDFCWGLIFSFLKICLRISAQFGSGRFSASEINFQELNWIYLWAIVISCHCLLEVMTRKRFQNSYV